MWCIQDSLRFAEDFTEFGLFEFSLVVHVNVHLVRDDQVHELIFHPIIIFVELTTAIDKVVNVRRCKQDHLH